MLLPVPNIYSYIIYINTRMIIPIVLDDLLKIQIINFLN